MGHIRRKSLILAACTAVLFATGTAQSLATPSVDVQLPGKFGALRVVNGAVPVQLDSSIGVQRRVNDRWESVPVANFFLRAKCGSSPYSCVSLGPGAELEPVPWTGNSCNSQCPTPCDLNGPLRPGIYRFLITSCDGKRTFASAPFEKRQ